MRINVAYFAILLSFFLSSCKKEDTITENTNKTTITINKPSIDIEVGQSYTLTYSINGTIGTNQLLLWSVNDPSLASINSKGEITALKVGEILVKIASEDGKLANQITLTIKPKDIAKLLRSQFNVEVKNVDGIVVEGVKKFEENGLTFLTGFLTNSKTWIKVFDNSGIELLDKRNDTDADRIELGYNEGSVKLDISTLPEFTKLTDDLIIYTRKNSSSQRFTDSQNKAYPPSQSFIGLFSKNDLKFKETSQFQSKSPAHPTFASLLKWSDDQIVTIYSTPDIKNIIGDRHLIKIYDYNLTLIDSLKNNLTGIDNVLLPLSKYEYLSVDPRELSLGQNLTLYKGVARRSMKNLSSFIWFKNEQTLEPIARREMQVTATDKLERDGHDLDSKYYFHKYKKTTFSGFITRYSIKIDLETGEIK